MYVKGDTIRLMPVWQLPSGSIWASRNSISESAAMSSNSVITSAESGLSLRKSRFITERERQSEKKISGVFTGSYANHPFTKSKVEIWIADYVLASYGTGAVMAVPCGDQRDWLFAKHYNIEILNIFKETDISKAAYEGKDAVILHRDMKE